MKWRNLLGVIVVAALAVLLGLHLTGHLTGILPEFWYRGRRSSVPIEAVPATSVHQADSPRAARGAYPAANSNAICGMRSAA